MPKIGPRKPDLSLKLVPKSRAQRRELDRAATLAGLKTGPWCLSVALAAARAAETVKAPPAAPKPAPAPIQPLSTLRTGHGSSPTPLTRSYDPDQS